MTRHQPRSYRHSLRLHYERIPTWRRQYNFNQSNPRSWRYQYQLYSNRRNPFRSTRSLSNRNIQLTSRNHFRYHYYLPTNLPLDSLPKHEVPNPKEEDSIAFCISTPEATETANCRIYSIVILNRKELHPCITAPIA